MGNESSRDSLEAVSRFFEIHRVLSLACQHGYPVRIIAQGVTYDGWVWGSSDSTSVVLCFGTQRHTFSWSEIEDAVFYTPLAERITGAWLKENL